MQSRWGNCARSLVASVAIFTIAGPAISADDMQSEMQAMRDMVLQMQDQLANQQQQLHQQAGRLQAAGIDNEHSSSSSLSSFLETTDFSGSAAVSYFYNTSTPPGPGGNTPTFSNPFHPDHNSFQLDELWLSASRDATDENTVGFGIDIVMGALGDVGTGIGTPNNGNSLWLNQAYIEWATPLGATVTAGKFATHIGYEVAGAAYNANITRGFTYNLLQPISQLGVKVSGDAGPVAWMVGVVNGFTVNQADPDPFKDIIWSLGVGGDMLSFNFAGEYGAHSGGTFGNTTNDALLLLDWILEATPSDAAVIWLDLTYAQVFEGQDVYGWGLNVGGHLAVTDRFGVAGRLEWARGNDGNGPLTSAAILQPGGSAALDSKTEAVSLTGTLDYLLAENLTLKGEVKWDHVTRKNNKNWIFDGGSDNDQVIVGSQLVLAF